MLKSIIQNIKQDIGSIYFPVSVLLAFLVCMLSPGIGALDYDYISRPTIIEELLCHNTMEFLSFSELYNYENIFALGVSGLFYAVLPLFSLSSVNRYCEEKISGYWIQKIMKTGQSIATVSNLIASSVISVLSVLMGLTLFTAFIMLRLPKQEVNIQVFGFHVFFICAMSVLGALLSILVAAVTKNKFYSFVIPVLFFYAENEFIAGSIYADFSIKALMSPARTTIAFVFILIMISLLYLAVDRAEKGRWGIGE